MPAVSSPQTLSTVLAKYELALEYLIQAHQATTPNLPISLESGSIIFATYRKIIAPYVTYIKGYANVVQNEQARNLPYHDDLKKLFQEFLKYQKEVQRIALYFPKSQQQAAVQLFYQEIGAPVVQTCFNIVQQTSYALTVEPGILASCYLAYQLALAIYIPTMSISGVETGSDVPTMMAKAMTTLYQTAITTRQNQLNSGLSNTRNIQTIFQEIEAYYKILSVVYMNAGNGNQSASMLQQVQAVQAQAQAYVQALSLYQQAQSIAAKSRNVILLDPLHPTKVLSAITGSQQQLLKAYQLLEQTQKDYEASSDPIGQQECTDALSMVTNIDMIVRFLGQLWSLYLTDQSTNNVMTAPTIAEFIGTNTAGSVTVQTVQQALQNLINLISQASNNVNQLATQPQLQQYSIAATINLLEQNILNASSLVTQDPLVSLVAAQQAQVALQYLQNMCQAILNAMNQRDTSSIALAMTYAKSMDTTFAGKERDILISLVPYFPNQLGSGATWTDWVAAILFAAQVVTSKALAYAQIGKAKIAQPVTAMSSVNAQKTTAQAIAMKKSATLEAQSGNFAAATTDYQQAFSAYQSLYAAQSQSASAAKWYQEAMLMRTLFSASSFASSVQAEGSITWETIKNIPTNYSATQYQFSQISMTDFGGVVLPPSLQNFAVGTSITVFTPQQEKDIFALLQAYMVNQILVVQGIDFADCFVDYTLSWQPTIVADAQTFAQQAITQVQQAMNGFKNSTVVSMMVQDAGTIVNLNCNYIPLSAVSPLYASMATAVTFLESSYNLFAPGATDVNIGGTQYVPGNQPAFADTILQEMVYTYLSEGYRHFTQAQKLMASVDTAVPKGQTAVSVKLPSNFEDVFQVVNKNIIRAQALLYAPEQSAYVYAKKSNNASLSAAIQNIFFNMYQVMIAWMKRCLIGDPFSQNYQMLLHQINTAYMNWGSMLDPVKDAAQIASFNLDIAQLFENAGKMCMETSYIESTYPGYTQIHYATAAHYFLAAEKKYTALKMVQLAAQMKSLVQEAYYKGSIQNIQLYFYVKKHGVSYTSDQTGQLVPISVAQMSQDSSTGFVDQGEQSAYNSVKNLLLNAGMGFEFLGNKSIKPSEKPKQTVAAQDALNPKSKQQQPSKIILYLRTQKIIDSKTLEVPYYQQGMVEKIFDTAADAYKKFEHDPETLESWMDTLLLAVQSLYAQDYMGVEGQQSGPEVAKQAQAFFQALQQESSSLENPSSAYVG